MARPLIGYRTPTRSRSHALVLARRMYTESNPANRCLSLGSVPLLSGEAASVRVRALGRPPNGEATPWSDAAAVEAGLLSRSDWTCSVIWASHQVDLSLPKQPVLFRKAFSLAKDVCRARLYITPTECTKHISTGSG